MFGERVLLLIPHPDDEVVGAAAAIGRLDEAGGKAFGVYLTSGVPASSGSWFGGRRRYDRIADHRWREAEGVSHELGICVSGRQRIPSRQLKSHLAQTLRWVRDQAERLGVDRIWTPAYEGGHQDHDVANFVASRLARDFDVWEFSEYHYAKGRVESQSFIEESGQESILVLDDFERTRKRELLGRYESEQRNLGYVGLEREIFRPLFAYDYTRPPHPGRTFYQRFQWVPYHPRIDPCQPHQVCEAFRAIAKESQS